MPRGTQFLTLVTDLRNELGRAESLTVGVDDVPSLKRALNQVYATLYLRHDWPHLRKVFDRMSLSAGQRYYDFPSGLNVERIEGRPSIWYSGVPVPIDRGISMDEYAIYSSDDDDRADPVQRWDVRWTGSSGQIEVWPIPSGNDQKLQFIGIRAISRLVNDDDVCLLDDDMVVLFAAAKLAKGEDAKRLQAIAQDHLDTLVGRTKGGVEGYRLGLGAEDTRRPTKAIVLAR